MSFLEGSVREQHVQNLTYIYGYILDIVITGNHCCTTRFDIILMNLYRFKK